MRKFLIWLGVVLLIVGIASFAVVRGNIQAKRKQAAEAAAQLGQPEMAPSQNIGLGDLVDFEKLKDVDQITPALAYVGIAAGLGGLVCVIGGLAIGMAKQQRPK